MSEPDPSTGLFGKCGFVTHEGDGVPVRAITMRTLMRETGIQTIDLLKVDIEGAEREVFETCDWIDCVRALVSNCMTVQSLGVKQRSMLSLRSSRSRNMAR